VEYLTKLLAAANDLQILIVLPKEHEEHVYITTPPAATSSTVATAAPTSIGDTSGIAGDVSALKI
jgi:hypothetical protein